MKTDSKQVARNPQLVKYQCFGMAADPTYSLKAQVFNFEVAHHWFGPLCDV